MFLSPGVPTFASTLRFFFSPGFVCPCLRDLLVTASASLGCDGLLISGGEDNEMEEVLTLW